MALPQPQQHPTTSVHRWTMQAIIVIAVLLLSSCSHKRQIYTSGCDIGTSFKKVSFGNLMDSISSYDQQYVEVSGKYIEDKELSALFNDGGLLNRSGSDALWINFSQDCPLYLSGTRHGLFEDNDGQFTRLNNRSVIIRGRVDVHNKGSHKQCKAALNRVSLVSL